MVGQLRQITALEALEQTPAESLRYQHNLHLPSMSSDYNRTNNASLGKANA